MPSIVNGTVAWITFRATMGRKRAFLFAIPAVIMLLITIAFKVGGAELSTWSRRSSGCSASPW